MSAFSAATLAASWSTADCSVARSSGETPVPSGGNCAGAVGAAGAADCEPAGDGACGAAWNATPEVTNRAHAAAQDRAAGNEGRIWEPRLVDRLNRLSIEAPQRDRQAKSRFSVIRVPSAANAFAYRAILARPVSRSWHPEVDVQQVHVPRQLERLRHVGLDDLPRDRQRRRLRVVVDVAVARALQLVVLLGDQPPAQLEREQLTLRDTRAASSAAVSRAFLWTHSHRMLSRISPVAMSSIRYSTSSLPKKSAGLSAAAWIAAAEGVAVLERDADQIARAADRPRARARAGTIRRRPTAA